MRCTQFVLFVLVGCCSGCSLLRQSSLTESAPMVIPGHTDRNQFTGQIGYGGKRGFDGSASYSLTKHLAVSGNVFINQQNFRDNPFPGWTTSHNTSVNSQYVEGQASWFWVKNHSMSWALAGGFGSGSRELRWLENQLDSRFNRYSLQVSGSWHGAGKKQNGLGLKLHYTDYLDASLQEATTAYSPAPKKIPPGAAHGMLGVDVVETIQIPITSLLTFNGQTGLYLSSGSVQLVSPGGSTDGYKNVGFIITAGMALSLPIKR